MNQAKDISNGKFKVTHNMSFSSEYNSWSAMKKRCLNPDKKHISYKGMYIDPRWISSFQLFLSDMGYKPTPQHTIDRIENSKGYSPSNCRWATRKEQNRNYSQNRHIEFNGEIMSVTEWAEKLNINRHLIFNRLKKGWSINNALTKKKAHRKARLQNS